MGKLFVVATPIGNTRDITLRALDVLSTVPVIACEDTRTTRKLLSEHGIKAPRLISYNEHNRPVRIPVLLEVLGKTDLALVSEAGVPGISDPGYDLVAATLEAGHDVVPIPGASAPVSALAASALPARRFIFVGFLPRKAGERRSELGRLASLDAAIVCFESPRRVRKTLEDVIAVLGDRQVVAAREISKVHEEFLRGTASEVLARLVNPLGEFTLVIAGVASAPPGTHDAPPPGDVASTIDNLLRRGLSTREIAGVLSTTYGLSRRDAYRTAVQARRADR